MMMLDTHTPLEQARATLEQPAEKVKTADELMRFCPLFFHKEGVNDLIDGTFCLRSFAPSNTWGGRSRGKEIATSY
jgi:hypothetical protein